MRKVRSAITATSVSLSRDLARRLWIHRLGLDRDAAFGRGAPGALATLRRLGYAQIDTIHVIERAHHHILWSRDSSYRPADLHRLQSDTKEVFEYWTHALSFIPTSDFRFFVRAMRAHELRPSRWFSEVTSAQKRALLARITREGPLSIRQIEEEKREKDHEWASRKPSKRALEHLFYSGRLAVSRREGMTKHYEKIERHFGWAIRPAPVSLREEAAYRLDRALNVQGVVTLESATYLESEQRAAVSAEIGRRLRAGRILRAEVPGVVSEGWIRPDDWEAVARLVPVDPERISILSPFDPLVIQRKRLRGFFDFDYGIECYLPAEKRKFGYFSLPVLAGENLVARVDLKADRESRRILRRSWHWEKGISKKREHRDRIEARIEEFAEFQFADYSPRRM